MNREEKTRKIALGVGYVSVMLIFAVICLTIFAVMSFKAAMSTDTFNERSGEFLQQYYAADAKAKETLSKLNDGMQAARGSMFFEEEFEEAAKALDGVSVKQSPNGFSASYEVPINDRQVLAVDIRFDNDGKYTIEQWQSRVVGFDDTESHLGVWDGNFD